MILCCSCGRQITEAARVMTRLLTCDRSSTREALDVARAWLRAYSRSEAALAHAVITALLEIADDNAGTAARDWLRRWESAPAPAQTAGALVVNCPYCAALPGEPCAPGLTHEERAVLAPVWSLLAKGGAL